MADHEAQVEITTGGSTFKISGTEAFVEKMIDTLPTLFPAEQVPPHEDDTKTHKKTSHGGAESIDDFVARIKLNNDLPATQRVAAFVYYLTEVEKKPSASKADIEECFDKTGLKTPGSLSVVINNALKESSGSLIRSVDRGQYGVTTNGKNLVKDMAKGGA